jgi:hypothetical protein
MPELAVVDWNSDPFDPDQDEPGCPADGDDGEVA